MRTGFKVKQRRLKLDVCAEYQSGHAVLLRSNQQTFLFEQEAVVTGGASMAVMLERVNRSASPGTVVPELLHRPEPAPEGSEVEAVMTTRVPRRHMSAKGG